jgi:hypothetical protein
VDGCAGRGVPECAWGSDADGRTVTAVGDVTRPRPAESSPLARPCFPPRR